MSMEDRNPLITVNSLSVARIARHINPTKQALAVGLQVAPQCADVGILIGVSNGVVAIPTLNRNPVAAVYLYKLTYMHIIANPPRPSVLEHSCDEQLESLLMKRTCNTSGCVLYALSVD